MAMVPSTAITSNVHTFILAGGKGQRLYPLTRDRAKPTVPIGGVHRLIDFTLSNCFNSGLRRISILAHYQFESLRSYLHAQTLWSPSRHHLAESVLCLSPTNEQGYRGTADAVFQNLSVVENGKADLVLILSGDHVYKMDYRDLLRSHMDRGAEVTVAGLEYPTHAASQFGVLQTDSEGYAVDFEEKPRTPKSIFKRSDDSLVSTGVYVFNTRTLVDALSADAEKSTSHDFGKDILPELVRSGRVSVFNFTAMGTRLGSYWRDVGTLESYYRVNMELLANSFFDAYTSAAWPIWSVDKPNRPKPIGTGVGHVVDSVISDKVSLGPGAEVIHSVLSAGVQIENAAVVHHSILMHNVRVGDGVRIVA
jgi:glucose-1-phosphate adenylyltransferase